MVPVWVFLLTLLLTASASLAFIICFKGVHDEHWHEIENELLIEFFKSIFIGVCVGIAVEVYLHFMEHRAEKDEMEKTVLTMLETAHVKSVHPSRFDCLDAFKNEVENPNVRDVVIVGISLREFLGSNGRMRPVWTSIWKRLQREEVDRTNPASRLKVRLLMLDPKSEEGRFRSLSEVENKVESDSIRDVEQSVGEVHRIQELLYQNVPQAFLQMKLYAHCPFSFMFLAERRLFVQQYYYREQEEDLSTPVVEFSGPSPRYDLFHGSLEIIWRKAPEKAITVGTALPIERARIKNIYLADERPRLSQRQVECIYATDKGAIEILAVSGKYYMGDVASTALLKVSKKTPESVSVRLAVVNPVSQQAILRAVGDDRPVGDIRTALCSWDWKRHTNSRLYQDITQTRSRVSDWRDRGHRFEGRLYSSSISCALLITPKAMFVEQYIYGRTKQRQNLYQLVGEYPVIEYGSSTKDMTEREIISSNFQIVWDCYSISFDDFEARDQEVEFAKNLAILQEELNCNMTP